MPTSDYLIHGTQPENLLKILKDGFINNKPDKKYIGMLQNSPSNQIFTQLIYRDIPNEKEQRPHWGMCAIVLDKKILKDYPFYATYVGGFKDNFDNGKTNNEETIIYGEGNLSRMPNLTKLKNIINKRVKTNALDSAGFMHSNEILFNKKILLDKYCKCIIIYGTYLKEKEKQNIIELANNTNIPIKFYDIKRENKFKGFGLNNFIDIIENK